MNNKIGPEFNWALAERRRKGIVDDDLNLLVFFPVFIYFIYNFTDLLNIDDIKIRIRGRFKIYYPGFVSYMIPFRLTGIPAHATDR